MKISLKNSHDASSGPGPVVEATDTGETATLHLPTGQVIVCNLYTYNGINCDENNIQPFVCLCNDGLGLFCNDITQANYESLMPYSKTLVDTYIESLEKNGYVGNFEQFIFAATPDETDQDVTRIIWKLGKKFTYGFSKDYKTVTITTPGEFTRLQYITSIIKQMYAKRLQCYFETWVSNIHLDGKVFKMEIGDPENNSYCAHKETEDFRLLQNSLSPGTYGCNYRTDYISDYRTNVTETQRKSFIKFTPFIYFLSEKEKKFLIAHELVHCKIGNLHGHDEYFWYMFEYCTGYNREDDWSFDVEQMNRDTDYWNSCANDPEETKICGLTTDVLIAEHQRAVRNDEDW